MTTALANKRLLLGVTGGIAAYKAAELCRLLIKGGADVHVVMTSAATRFVAPLTFETLSGHPVGTELFALGPGQSIQHTELGRHVDAVVVAPATADFLGKLAHGLADDLLTNVLLASHVPVLLCPAMNVEMWDNPLVQQNLERLVVLPRFTVLTPDVGWLACNVDGRGRLPEAERIVRHVDRLFLPRDLTGRRLLVTAGPTREWVDPVRFISNPSSGRMGLALAEAAWARGAEVTLIHGPLAIAPPPEVAATLIDTTAELHHAVLAALPGTDALIMAAAPADWRPMTPSAEKRPKTAVGSLLTLEPTIDVLASVTHHAARPRVVVGFAAESHDVLARSMEKARRKRVDLLFGNVVERDGVDTGFGAPTNAGFLVDGDGALLRAVPLGPKAAVAHAILDAVVARLGAAP